MSDNKEEIKEEVPVEVVVPEEAPKDETTEPKLELVKEIKEAVPVEEVPVEEDENESIFITESDTFDIKVKWYKVDKTLFIEDSDSEFDEKFEDMNEFTATFKCPSQGDYEIIVAASNYKSPEEMKVSDVLQMELTRVVTLVRKWTLPQPLERMVQLDPYIIQSIMTKVRDVLGMKGIL